MLKFIVGLLFNYVTDFVDIYISAGKRTERTKVHLVEKSRLLEGGFYYQ
jgi:hypothetical protein